MRPKLPYRGWLFDLDGTVYVGDRLIPGAAECLATLRAAGRQIAFLTNKPLQTRAEYAAKLTRLGVPAAPDDVINSSLVLARYLRDRDPGAPVFVIGEPPMLEEMRAHGFEVRADERVRWVVIAFDRTFDYAKLNTALQAVKQGARLIATNPDRTCPVEGGEIPDCAGMIAAVEAVTDRKVETIVGKPSPIILEVALAAARRPRGRRGDGRRPHRDRHRDGPAARARHHPRAERRHARGRSPNRRGRSGPRGTIHRGTGGVSAPANRLAGLDGAALDAVVIGGGMAGAGVARDLALRGASVALFEKGDFASGTSSKSSKLIHGGLRYLELGDVELVRESLREKRTLERLAPHLVRPLPFLVPVYRGASARPHQGAARDVALRSAHPGQEQRALPRAAARGRARDGAERAGGGSARRGLLLDDLLLFPERLCLENMLSAARHGARVLNYCQVEAIVPGARGLDGVQVRDLLSGQVQAVKARTIVNCAGPWVDGLRALAGVGRSGARGCCAPPRASTACCRA